MNAATVLVCFIFVVLPSQATIILIGTSKDGIVVAADKRVTHDLNAGGNTNDSYVKTIRLKDNAAFVTVGTTQFPNPLTGKVGFDLDVYTKEHLSQSTITSAELANFQGGLSRALTTTLGELGIVPLTETNAFFTIIVPYVDGKRLVVDRIIGD